MCERSFSPSKFAAIAAHAYFLGFVQPAPGHSLVCSRPNNNSITPTPIDLTMNVGAGGSKFGGLSHGRIQTSSRIRRQDSDEEMESRE